jgi:hypothetical protein
MSFFNLSASPLNPSFRMDDTHERCCTTSRESIYNTVMHREMFDHFYPAPFSFRFCFPCFCPSRLRPRAHKMRNAASRFSCSTATTRVGISFKRCHRNGCIHTGAKTSSVIPLSSPLLSRCASRSVQLSATAPNSSAKLCRSCTTYIQIGHNVSIDSDESDKGKGMDMTHSHSPSALLPTPLFGSHLFLHSSALVLYTV